MLIAIGFLLLLKYFPECMVFCLLSIVPLILIVVMVVTIVEGLWQVALICGFILLISLLLLYCFWQRIKIGILFLKISATFITEKPSVYVAPLYPFIFGKIFFIFWIVSFFPLISAANNSEAAPYFIIFYIFMLVFMNEFLFYLETFLIATACADWYYSVEDNYYTTAIGRINCFHIGSITFGSIIITIITFLRRFGEIENEEGQRCCCCCCCLRCMEGIIRVLNHNAVIVMAVTG